MESFPNVLDKYKGKPTGELLCPRENVFKVDSSRHNYVESQQNNIWGEVPKCYFPDYTYNFACQECNFERTMRLRFDHAFSRKSEIGHRKSK